jgi:Xaa-Pro dipeptidase
MSTVSRRSFFGISGAALAASSGLQAATAKVAAAHAAPLRSLTRNAQPISSAEHAARIAKLQSLLQQRQIGALLVEAGSALQYFTGIRWWRSERTTAAVIPAEGEVIVVTPFFEEPSVRENLKVSAQVRPWKEDQSPFELLAGALRALPKYANSIAVEATLRYFIVDQVSKLLGAGVQVVPGDDLVRACRLIKSPTELALMQAANNVTIAAIRHVHAHTAAGMSAADLMRLLVDATEALGGNHEFSLVLLNEASAFPHGSDKPQSVRAGSVVLVDSGCTVHGYSSDISRSWIHGTPTARQREIWNTVKRGQELALETAQPGVPVGAIDKAVRAYYEGLGWSKDYGLPGTSHRTGHGIGMDGHEPPYLVRSDTTPLQAGMCFSDEPGIYVPGEFGIRLEDCWYMTEAGPKLFTPLAKSIDDPV